MAGKTKTKAKPTFTLVSDDMHVTLFKGSRPIFKSKPIASPQHRQNCFLFAIDKIKEQGGDGTYQYIPMHSDCCEEAPSNEPDPLYIKLPVNTGRWSAKMEPLSYAQYYLQHNDRLVAAIIDYRKGFTEKLVAHLNGLDDLLRRVNN